ncbi:MULTISPECIES: M23 family metallopeptidase [Mesobacillus]|uniref:LysM domain-containing protein n=2 Tax=Mesobacillus TaxID=2675231 RepID=A0A0D6Z6S0_9BACI|nr:MULTISPECIES: M23 family metallopeptidase [Mesobacillus]KIY21267.1 hypothetical protein UB32_14610 [Mesobacillus subterraneus]MDQ0412155.1 murein DD-endopeptidase MepM/ murein hydrolase activator NlpD [Mesobacillus stamsii]
MQDYLKRLLIAGLMGLCISLLFLGGKHTKAETLDIPELTSDWVWPAGGVITDLYGTRHGHHKGIDIAGGLKTPIHSVDNGIVTKSYYSGSYGHVVFIKHENNLETVYAHLNNRMVKEGQEVKQGDVIGLMGNTGDSSGVHLHFEMHKEKWTYEKENAVDPVLALGNTAVGEPVEAMALARAKESTMETVGKLQLPAEIAINQQDSWKAESNDNLQQKLPEVSQRQPEIKHIVKAGETLWSLAKMNDTTVEVIKQSNQLNSDQIASGVVLVIPKPIENKYIVVSGDTLISIARKTNTTVNQLKAWNNLQTDTIQPQQVLDTR